MLFNGINVECVGTMLADSESSYLSFIAQDQVNSKIICNLDPYPTVRLAL